MGIHQWMLILPQFGSDWVEAKLAPQYKLLWVSGHHITDGWQIQKQRSRSPWALVAALVVLVQKRGVLKSVVRGSSDFILGLERFNHTREPFQMLDQRWLQHLICRLSMPCWCWSHSKHGWKHCCQLTQAQRLSVFEWKPSFHLSSNTVKSTMLPCY